MRGVIAVTVIVIPDGEVHANLALEDRVDHEVKHLYSELC